MCVCVKGLRVDAKRNKLFESAIRTRESLARARQDLAITVNGSKEVPLRTQARYCKRVLSR